MKRHILINNLEEIEDGMTTVLINTDSARLHTGFANCGRVMADHLYEAVDENGNAKYNISYLGWYDNPRSHINRPYKMYKTITNPAINDKWGQITLPSVIEKEKPDIVISIGDTWMIYHVNKTRGRDTFKHVFYMPADGEPLPREMLIKGGGKIDWRQNVLDTDYVISYCPFGTRVIDNMVGHKTVYRDIPFGVYTEVYTPAKDDADKKAIRKKTFPSIPENAFIIGFFSRNQPRKAVDRLVHAVSVFQHKHETPDRPVYLYFHCAMDDDSGWNIPELIKTYKMKKGRHISDQELKVGLGVDDQEMRNRYVACDIMALPTRGEGWGITILESMSCGIPVLTTKYSAHADFCGPGSLFIKPAAMVSEPVTNIQRYVVSIADFVAQIGKSYNSKTLRNKLGTQGRKVALKYDWKKVAQMWEDAIDSIDISGLPSKDRSTALEEAVEEGMISL